MNQEDDRTFSQRWLMSSVVVWCWLAPIMGVICVVLKLFSIGEAASIPWAAIVVVPALGSIPGVALFCGWLTFMTHRWDVRD